MGTSHMLLVLGVSLHNILVYFAWEVNLFKARTGVTKHGETKVTGTGSRCCEWGYWNNTNFTTVTLNTFPLLPIFFMLEL